LAKGKFGRLVRYKAKNYRVLVGDLSEGDQIPRNKTRHTFFLKPGVSAGKKGV